MALPMTSCTCSGPTGPFAAVLDVACPIHGGEAAAIATEAIERDRAIFVRDDQTCQLCGKVAETRPYGPNGEEVCFDCGMKDEAAVKRAFEARFNP